MALNYRRGGSTYQISIYDSTNTSWEDSIQIRQSGTTKYAQLDSDISTDNASHMRLRKNGTTYAILTTETRPQELFAWGDNGAGGLGLEDIVDRSSPTKIGSDVNWKSISVGTTEEGLYAFTYAGALKRDNSLWMWGRNNQYQLAQGDTVDRSSPVQVGSDTDWTQISLGHGQCMGLKSDGTVWYWGRQYRGEFGVGTQQTTQTTIAQVGDGTNWIEIFCGFYNTGFLKDDNTLWLTGENSEGCLGLGDSTWRSYPVQLGGSWSKASLNSRTFSLFLKTNGTLWASGRNNIGQLGQGNIIYRSSPVQIGSDTDWVEINNSLYTSIAIKSDGTIWSWGGDYNGALGQGTSGVHLSSPTQIGSDTDWYKIACLTTYVAIALKTDGTLWGWGNNYAGQLGIGDTANRSSPVQIGSLTTWDSIQNGGLNSVIALQKN